jgi:CDP-diacylglycerol--serine O-phosphatidyltransferase
MKGKLVPISVIIPNFITLLALCLGVSSLFLVIQNCFDWAAVAVVGSMILDGLDGKIARLLKGTSYFGAQLDSLADLVNFGVAPSFIVYNMSLCDLGKMGWAISLCFVCALALRLARFNVEFSHNIHKSNTLPYLSIGLPAPAAAYMCLFPSFLFFATGESYFLSPPIVGAFLLFISFFMISRLPTFLVNKVPIQKKQRVFFLFLIMILMALLISEFWWGLCTIGTIQILSWPFSYYQKKNTPYCK